jgi:hypothetical protein
MSTTIIADDGRELSKPEKVPFLIQIGERRRPDKNYTTDEQMVLTAPCGWLLKESVPKPLSKYVTNPILESKHGDNRKWACPAGSHIKSEKLKELLEDAEGIEIDYWRENEGRHNQTRAAVQVTTEEIEVSNQ